MVCSYCETENKVNVTKCEFCQASLGERRPKLKEFTILKDCERTFDELRFFHTYDLLVLLRLVRQERTKSYDLMRTLKKASERPEIDKDMVLYSEECYRVYTKRMKVIEGILIDRMGYKPKRIDDKLLEALRYRMD
ncbi:hypothetical protein [Priestia megaterium]|uniref:hypothetical protein n=1 Tax=Priestia megaterium TaxID=1404 RepID=UPI001A93F3F2|nr:hypothetical protein [Priestia megaterium]QSX24480.1 hypothetical protein J0P05_32980 [Priestia megaterium]